MELKRLRSMQTTWWTLIKYGKSRTGGRSLSVAVFALAIEDMNDLESAMTSKPLPSLSGISAWLQQQTWQDLLLILIELCEFDRGRLRDPTPLEKRLDLDVGGRR